MSGHEYRYLRDATLNLLRHGKSLSDIINVVVAVADQFGIEPVEEDGRVVWRKKARAK